MIIFRRVRRSSLVCGVAAILMLMVAAVLPVESLLDFLSGRYNTVRNFRGDYSRGLMVFRIVLTLNALLVASLPWVLARCRVPKFDSTGEVSSGDFLPLLLVMAAAALSLPWLGSSFQIDEWRTLNQYIRHGPLVILTRSPIPDNHVLYSLLAWPFVALLGPSEVALRIPSWVLASLAPAILYGIVKPITGRIRAVLLSLLLSASPFMIWFATEGRSYAPVVTVTLALFALQRRALLDIRMGWWIVYVAMGVCAVYFQTQV